MLYRMKQNAVGLANICILSTMVLVTVSTTVSLYGGVTDILAHRYPYDLEAHFYNAAEPVKGYARSVLEQQVQEAGLEIEEMVDYELSLIHIWGSMPTRWVSLGLLRFFRYSSMERRSFSVHLSKSQ